MKKFLSLLLVLNMLVLSSCGGGLNTNGAKKGSAAASLKGEVIESVNLMTEREFGFNSDVQFSYTGDDKIIKAITDDMVEDSVRLFGNQGAVEIPTPYIVKVDNSNKNDIKVYGNFYIFGYTMYGTIFNNKNGSSNPGCYHLKEENGDYVVLKKEIAEDGSNNWNSLVKICGGDEELAKSIHPKEEIKEAARQEYAKMYAKANNLNLSGIKDYGWPIILFSEISDASFVYNFYRSYFDEVRQEDYLNDFVNRIENLKNKYMTSDLIAKVDEMTMDVGADMVINAQDVTDQMVDTLLVEDYGDGNVKVSYETGSKDKTVIVLKVSMANGKKIITDLNY